MCTQATIANANNRDVSIILYRTGFRDREVGKFQYSGNERSQVDNGQCNVNSIKAFDFQASCKFRKAATLRAFVATAPVGSATSNIGRRLAMSKKEGAEWIKAEGDKPPSGALLACFPNFTDPCLEEFRAASGFVAMLRNINSSATRDCED